VRKVLVAGALGVVGRAVLRHLETREGVRSDGLSRRPPDFSTETAFVRADLADASATADAVAPHRDTTHLVYTALHERPELVRGWHDPVQIESNRRMLANLLDALAGAPLSHVTLLQGTKAYGIHAGARIRVPLRESDAHRSHANFYWEQEDLLRERAERLGFATTIFRPQIVLGVASGSAMNPVAALGAFALLRRAQGLPLAYPGHPDAIVECTDARLLARAIVWAWDAPAAAGATFNVTNGDVVAWSDLFPAIAAHFGMELGPPEALRPSVAMPPHAAYWRALAEREGLREPDLERLIGLSWQYADVLWASPQRPERPALVSTVALREAGFGDCIDTEACLLELFRAYEDEGYFPRRSRSSG
jgi:nucleoside-diphosphate-sugar epimerase